MKSRDGFATAIVISIVLALAVIGGIAYAHYVYFPHMTAQNGSTSQTSSSTSLTTQTSPINEGDNNPAPIAVTPPSQTSTSIAPAVNPMLVDFGNYPLVVDSGGNTTFSWMAPTSTTSEKPIFSIECVSGITMYDVTNNRPFLCGDQTRYVEWKGSDNIQFTSASPSRVQLTAQIIYPGEPTPTAVNFSIFPVETLAQPQDLAATLNTSTYGFAVVELSWSGEGFGTSATSDVYTYDIYKSTTSGFTPTANDESGGTNSFSYTDTSVSLNPGTYYYRVQAQDRGGNVGPLSAQASVVVP
jgi:hypothetical protein